MSTCEHGHYQMVYYENIYKLRDVVTIVWGNLLFDEILRSR